TRAADLAARFAGDAKKVVNMLNVAGGAQVMLKVRIAEMDRSISKQFNVNLSAAANVDGAPGPTTTTTTVNSNNSVCPNNAQGILNALEQVGLVHMLAEPNLTAVSG